MCWVGVVISVVASGCCSRIDNRHSRKYAPWTKLQIVQGWLVALVVDMWVNYRSRPFRYTGVFIHKPCAFNFRTNLHVLNISVAA